MNNCSITSFKAASRRGDSNFADQRIYLRGAGFVFEVVAAGEFIKKERILSLLPLAGNQSQEAPGPVLHLRREKQNRWGTCSWRIC